MQSTQSSLRGRSAPLALSSQHVLANGATAALKPKLEPMPIAVCFFDGRMEDAGDSKTIKLPRCDWFGVAEQFAKDVHHAVIDRDLALLDGRARSERCLERIQEIRAAIRSIADKFSRRDFVQTMGWHLKRLTDSRELRGRAFVARCRQVEAERAAERKVAA